ncbi:unnamed protein product, partial [Amoebophrya sp. A25]|eukprot:GSA25T00003727001.1
MASSAQINIGVSARGRKSKKQINLSGVEFDTKPDKDKTAARKVSNGIKPSTEKEPQSTTSKSAPEAPQNDLVVATSTASSWAPPEIPSASSLISALRMVTGKIVGCNNFGLLLRLVSLLHTWSYRGSFELLVAKGVDFIFPQDKAGNPINDVMLCAVGHAKSVLSTVIDGAAERKQIRDQALQRHAKVQAENEKRKAAATLLKERREQLKLVESYSKALDKERFTSMCVENGNALQEQQSSASAAAALSATCQGESSIDLGGREFWVTQEKLGAEELAYYSGDKQALHLLMLRQHF